MNELAEGISDVRAELAADADEFMADLCTLTVRAFVPDGYGGSTETTSTPATNIPCSWEALGSPIERPTAGAAPSLLTHKITMPSTAATEAIRSNYRIIVAARDHTPALTFEHPTILGGSLAPFCTVAASLNV